MEVNRRKTAGVAPLKKIVDSDTGEVYCSLNDNSHPTQSDTPQSHRITPSRIK